MRTDLSDRLFTEAERRADEAWAEYHADKQRRLAELDRKHPIRDPRVWEGALTEAAIILCFGVAMLASAGLIAGMQ